MLVFTKRLLLLRLFFLSLLLFFHVSTPVVFFFFLSMDAVVGHEETGRVGVMVLVEQAGGAAAGAAPQ